MAEVSQRTWRIPGQRGRRKAWGFTLQVPCQPCPHKRKTGDGPVHPDGVRQEKHYRAEWTREDAEEALAKKLLQIEPVKPKTAGITFGEATERYLAAKTRKRSLRDDTRILGHLVGYFGKETPLADITASRISAYKGHRLKTTRKIGDEERPLSIATVNRTLAILRHLLRLAHDEWEVLDTAPRIRMEREPEGRLRWLTPEDAARLLEACRESRNDGLVDLVEFALFTGMRRGEALGLTWDRVDRARGVVQLEETKSGKRREVPLNSRADAVLARRGSKSTGLVFGTRNWDHFRSAWERAVERAKLPDFHFHDLRHSFASWAIQRGATLQEVKDLLGHSSLAMTLRYGHLAPEHLRSAVARLDAALPVTASAQISAHEPAREVELLQK